MKIHILGIAGTFMSGIAILAKQKGHEVSGSDNACYDPVKSVLEKQNIPISLGYKNKDLTDKDLIIIGNVMSRGNPIIEFIMKNNIKYTSGPSWLNENVLNNKKVIAISGTHGKTTTTSMIVHIMRSNNLNPSYLIGGDPVGKMKSANLTKSEYFVIEADEYDTAFFDKQSKFVHYNPYMLIINNIEFDHADIFNNINDIIKSFHHLIRLVPPNGKIIVNNNDKNIRKLLKIGYWSKLVTIDSKKNMGDYNMTKNKSYFINYDKSKYRVPDNIIGHHNNLNAATAISACNQLKISIKKQIKYLENFKGVKKRLELLSDIDGKIIYEDFAHHPTSIKLAIDSMKEKYKTKKLLTIFLPSSNSMKLGIHNNQLLSCLNKSDFVLIITKIRAFESLKRNNNKINVIESEAQISQYLTNNKHDLILILSNKNTKEVKKYLK
tara:strand:- start:3704 stop:5014 length:1311 start_codon:yes stop_codon:yes gene_type:complete